MKTMLTASLTALALTAVIAVPAMADEGVMPQASKIIVNDSTTQQGVPMGHGAKSGKKHMGKKHMGKKMHHGKKHHRMHKKAATK